jgi:oxygen-independent coproporphyrinogen-3 oxidase
MRPEAYIQCLSDYRGYLPYPQTPATIRAERIDAETDQFETIMMGLRLLDEGFSLNGFAARYGFRFEDRFAKPIEELTRWGLLREQNQHLFLTQRARLISNQVFTRFVQETGKPWPS